MDIDLNTQRQFLLSNFLLNEDLLRKYKQLKSNEDRFKLALDVIVENSAKLFDSEYTQKNTERSIELRTLGNKCFINSQFYTAIQAYTESILYAIDSSEELALAYANRSAALFKVKKYEDCVNDIDRALNLKYPDRLKMKLYERKGLCLTELGRPNAASSFEEALVWLEKTTLSKKEINQSKMKLVNLISAPSTVDKPPEKLVTLPLPEIRTPSAELPSASDAVALEYSKERGRHLVATRKIKPGEILVIEKPYCMKLLPTCVCTHCEYCLQVAWSMIPCQYCVHAAFCSNACRDKAWDEYHEIECLITESLQSFTVCDSLRLSTRMTIMATKKGTELNALRQELIDIDRNTDPRTKGFDDDGKFCSDKYRSISTLPNNLDMCIPMHLLYGGLWSALVVCALARESKMFGKKLALETLTNNPDVIFVGGLMLKHVHIALMKPHGYGAAQRSAASEQGQALMAVFGLTHHSCDPNTIRQWYGDRLALYAAFPIKEGEEILDSCGLRYIAMPKGERQKLLNIRTVINCKCIPCVENWPLLSHVPSYKKQPLPKKDQDKLDEVLQKFTATFNGFVQRGVSDNLPKMLKEVVNLIEILYELVQRPCSELTMAVLMLGDLYASADIVFDYKPIGFSGIEMQCSVFCLYLADVLSKK